MSKIFKSIVVSCLIFCSSAVFCCESSVDVLSPSRRMIGARRAVGRRINFPSIFDFLRNLIFPVPAALPRVRIADADLNAILAGRLARFNDQRLAAEFFNLQENLPADLVHRVNVDRHLIFLAAIRLNPYILRVAGVLESLRELRAVLHLRELPESPVEAAEALRLEYNDPGFLGRLRMQILVLGVALNVIRDGNPLRMDAIRLLQYLETALIRFENQ